MCLFQKMRSNLPHECFGEPGDLSCVCPYLKVARTHRPHQHLNVREIVVNQNLAVSEQMTDKCLQDLVYPWSPFIRVHHYRTVKFAENPFRGQAQGYARSFERLLSMAAVANPKLFENIYRRWLASSDFPDSLFGIDHICLAQTRSAMRLSQG